MTPAVWVVGVSLAALVIADIYFAWRKPHWIWEWDLFVGVVGLGVCTAMALIAFDKQYPLLGWAAVVLGVLHVLRIFANLRMRWRERRAERAGGDQVDEVDQVEKVEKVDEVESERP